MLTDEEKIQRAKEIYYRRNGISFRGEEKKKKHNKSFIFIILISLRLYISAFLQCLYFHLKFLKYVQLLGLRKI